MEATLELQNERLALQAQQQREWIAQQKREHEQQAAADHNERCDYAMQTDANTRMRGMLHDNQTAGTFARMKAVQEENKRMAQQKRDRETQWKKDQHQSNCFELNATINHSV